MNLTQYFPYPELTITWNPNHSSFELNCPWVNIQVEVDKENLEHIKANSSPVFTSSFLEFFKEYPIAFIKKSNDKKFNMSNLYCFSKIGDTQYYDPLAVYTFLRRTRLQQEQQVDSHINLYEKLDQLRKQNENKFFDACALILTQTHYITSKCVESLEPAVLHFHSNLLLNFINEERGHDKLVLKSLSKLPSKNTHPVLSSTIESMNLLKKTAQNSPMAFACIVGAFEGNNYAPKDPLSVVLSKSSVPEAAIGIDQHFQINKNGNHSLIGEFLSRELPEMKYNEVLKAEIATDKITNLGNNLINELVTIIFNGDEI